MRGVLRLEWPYNRGNTVPHRGLHGHDVCQLLVAGRWFSLGTPVSSTKKTHRHDISEILLKVALNTITPFICYNWVIKELSPLLI